MALPGNAGVGVDSDADREPKSPFHAETFVAAAAAAAPMGVAAERRREEERRKHDSSYDDAG